MDSRLVNHLGRICVHLDSIHIEAESMDGTRTYSVPHVLVKTLRESGGRAAMSNHWLWPTRLTPPNCLGPGGPLALELRV